jgi:hypothetical protein
MNDNEINTGRTNQKEALLDNRVANLIKPLRMSCLPSLQGRIIVGFVYLLFSFLYFITIYYGVLGMTFTGPVLAVSSTSVLINGCLFSLFFTLMVASHVQCVLTNPGALPRNYEQLNELDLPVDFSALI